MAALVNTAIVDIKNGVETLISIQDDYPTIEISMDGAEHVHLYQIIEE